MRQRIVFTEVVLLPNHTCTDEAMDGYFLGRWFEHRVNIDAEGQQRLALRFFVDTVYLHTRM